MGLRPTRLRLLCALGGSDDAEAFGEAYRQYRRTVPCLFRALAEDGGYEQVDEIAQLCADLAAVGFIEPLTRH